MTLELLLIRHGETDWNRNGRVQGSSDVALNILGHQQAVRLAEFLAPTALDAIYVSTSQRAIQTAAPLAKTRSFVPIQSSQIVEINYGHWEGHTVEQIVEKWPKEWSEYKRDSLANRPPVGETIEQVHFRLTAFFEGLKQRHSDGRIAVVSHGGAIGHMISLLISEAALAATRIQLANCAISRIVIGERGIKLVSLGEVHFLKELLADL